MLQFHSVGALPWLLGRRDGLGRGIYNRQVADHGFPSEQITTEAQYCLYIPLSSNGNSAYPSIFRSNPAELYGQWGDQKDLMFAREPSISGRSAQQWKLSVISREAAQQETANGELRRRLAYNRPFNCTDV